MRYLYIYIIYPNHITYQGEVNLRKLMAGYPHDGGLVGFIFNFQMVGYTSSSSLIIVESVHTTPLGPDPMTFQPSISLVHWKKSYQDSIQTWQWALKYVHDQLLLSLQKTLATVLGKAIYNSLSDRWPLFLGGFSVSLCYVDVSYKKLPGYLELRSPANGPKPKNDHESSNHQFFRGVCC